MLYDKQLTQNDIKMDIDYQNMMIEERHHEIVGLAHQMQELNDLNKTMAELVQGHGYIVDSIYNNIIESNKNVNDGKKDLEKAEKHQEDNNSIALGVLITTIISVMTGGAIVIGTHL